MPIPPLAPRLIWTLSLALVGASACKGGEDAAPGDTKASASPEKTVAKAVAAAEAEAGADKLFDATQNKALRKKGCDFLTPEMVASALEVPAGELKQMKIMGCVYSWSKDGQTLEARISMLRAHKTLDGAKQWFTNATTSKSEAQAAADLEQVKKKVQERKEIDTDLKKKTAGDITDMMKMGTPDGGLKFTDVPGIGDEARQTNSDGAIWVRLRNLTFNISAYKGAEPPKPKVNVKDPKAMAAEAIQIQKQWVVDTLDQRRKDAEKLAPAILKAIEAG